MKTYYRITTKDGKIEDEEFLRMVLGILHSSGVKRFIKALKFVHHDDGSIEKFKVDANLKHETRAVYNSKGLKTHYESNAVFKYYYYDENDLLIAMKCEHQNGFTMFERMKFGKDVLFRPCFHKINLKLGELYIMEEEEI